jgi:hypothetical protein
MTGDFHVRCKKMEKEIEILSGGPELLDRIVQLEMGSDRAKGLNLH